MKRGFADYTAFVARPRLRRRAHGLAPSPAYATARAAEIRTDAITAERDGRRRRKRQGEPQHHVAVGRRRRRATWWRSRRRISDFFGAKVIVPGTGIILNNEMKNFASRGINAMAPGQADADHDRAELAAEGRPAVRDARHAWRRAHRVDDDAVGVEPDRLQDGHSGGHRGAALLRARHRGRRCQVEARCPRRRSRRSRRSDTRVKTPGDFDLFFGGAQGIVIDPKTGARDRRRRSAPRRRGGGVLTSARWGTRGATGS